MYSFSTAAFLRVPEAMPPIQKNTTRQMMGSHVKGQDDGQGNHAMVDNWFGTP
jgi:hypothetical protein